MSQTATITRRVTFCAAHRLHNPKYSDEENQRIFDHCANPNGHGHNYVLEVSISGEVNPETGMVLNLDQIKEVLKREVIARLDHKNLNLDVDFLRGVIPTAENLARKIGELLVDRFTPAKLTRIILWETENSRVEINL